MATAAPTREESAITARAVALLDRTEAGERPVSIFTTYAQIFLDQGKGQPIEALFKLATAFTHPRRIEVFRAVKSGADSFGKLQAATHISARALSRHLVKLEARGFLKSEMEVYALTNLPHPFGRVLARLAGE